MGDKTLLGTLSLYEDAAVLTHQNTVRKDRRLHQGPEEFYPPSPTVHLHSFSFRIPLMILGFHFLVPITKRVFRYTVGAGRADSSLMGLGKVAGTYAPYFGALVPLRLCRAKACP